MIMSTRILVQHQTKYSYDRAVFLSPHLIRLKPAAHALASIETYSLHITPTSHQLRWQQDPFGNFVARVDFHQPVTELIVDVKLLATLNTANPFDFLIDDYAQSYPFEYEAQLKKDLCSYLEVSDTGLLMTQWLNGIDRSTQEVISFLIIVNQKIHEHISYTVRMEPGVQNSEQSLETALGSCRDSAWLLVQVLRNLGLAARFVSGYLVQLNTTEEGLDKNGDLVSLHAWAEVYIPGAGWIGLDPTGGLLTTESHIPLACTSNPASAAAVTGNSEITDTIFSYTSSILRF